MRRGPEKQFWTWLDATIAGLWHVQRHEDKYSVGIPDLSYGANGKNGWIELKAYDKWPSGPLPHFTAEQLNWLQNRGRKGNNCWLLVRINRTILLFKWDKLNALRTNNCKKKTMVLLSEKIWDETFDRKEFIRLIT